jgi:uncharacterized DUF497 family protein
MLLGFSTGLSWSGSMTASSTARVRVYAIGLVNGIEITVIYTDRDEDERHIISAWRAEPHERRYYWQNFQS